MQMPTLLICLLICSSCVPQQVEENPILPLTGEYLGQHLPGDTVSMFAPGILSGQWAERDMAISPKGDELYYTLVSPRSRYQVIVRRKKTGDIWSAPQVVPFSGRYPDLEPAFSPDGTRLFFASKRPREGTGPAKDWDIWYVERSGTGWSPPIHAGPRVNTEADEFFPSVTESGTLYFTATFEGGKGREDLYSSTWNGQAYSEAKNLGDSINTPGYEFNAFVAPDESYLIYSSFGRKDGQGGGDLYISYRTASGGWTSARNMGLTVNSPMLDYCPFVSPDGEYFFFTSEKGPEMTSELPRSYEDIIDLFQGTGNGNSNIYWVRFDAVK